LQALLANNNMLGKNSAIIATWIYHKEYGNHKFKEEG
jgi:hypothetical protein